MQIGPPPDQCNTVQLLFDNIGSLQRIALLCAELCAEIGAQQVVTLAHVSQNLMTTQIRFVRDQLAWVRATDPSRWALPGLLSGQDKHLTAARLTAESVRFRRTGGISAEASQHGFEPAFLDQSTGQVYRSCFADGSPAPIHMLDGLPDDLVRARDHAGRTTAAKSSVIAGFVKAGKFYARDQAARKSCAP